MLIFTCSDFFTSLTQYFGDHNRIEFYVRHENCSTYAKTDKGYWRDVGPIEALKQKMMVSNNLNLRRHKIKYFLSFVFV